MVLDDALLQVAQIQQLAAPSKQDWENFQDILVLSIQRLGNEVYGFKGIEQYTWNEPEDLVTLRFSKNEEDDFQKLLGGSALSIYHQLVGKRQMVIYSAILF